MQVPDPLVCGGRLVDDTGRPHGPACAARFRAFPAHCPPEETHGWLVGFRPASDTERDEQARCAGWAVAALPDGTRTATCPRCRKPDRAVVAACREIQEGLTT
jgi:hypothetical protein